MWTYGPREGGVIEMIGFEYGARPPTKEERICDRESISISVSAGLISSWSASILDREVSISTRSKNM